MDYDLDYDFMIDDQSCMRSCPPTLFSSLYSLFPIKNGGVSDFGGKMDSNWCLAVAANGSGILGEVMEGLCPALNR